MVYSDVIYNQQQRRRRPMMDKRRLDGGVDESLAEQQTH